MIRPHELGWGKVHMIRPHELGWGKVHMIRPHELGWGKGTHDTTARIGLRKRYTRYDRTNWVGERYTWYDRTNWVGKMDTWYDRTNWVGERYTWYDRTNWVGERYTWYDRTNWVGERGHMIRPHELGRGKGTHDADWAFPVSILYKSIAGSYRPVRVADGPITARYRFMKNASWVRCSLTELVGTVVYIEEQKMPRFECTNLQADLDLRFPQNAWGSFSYLAYHNRTLKVHTRLRNREG